VLLDHSANLTFFRSVHHGVLTSFFFNVWLARSSLDFIKKVIFLFPRLVLTPRARRLSKNAFFAVSFSCQPRAPSVTGLLSLLRV